MSSNVCVHICKFAFLNKHEADTKAQYIALFETLLEPHFNTKSPMEVTQRRLELRNILDLAIELGIKALGLAHDITEYRWGPRDNNMIMLIPAFHFLVYKDQELDYDVTAYESVSSGIF